MLNACLRKPLLAALQYLVYSRLKNLRENCKRAVIPWLMILQRSLTWLPPPERENSDGVINCDADSLVIQKGRKLKQYVLEEKLDIIDYAKVIGNRAAGREFNVAESSIREWRKNEQRLRSMFETAPERSRLDGGGRRPVSEELEKGLVSS
ncbi:unnamed protein product [Gongylonema pulchrum]|uniref:HTH psq-type domain-containing protein n=1 Tax=Gongylonema pulchrum TaxID=637853 RepID=A0A183DR51_9BILA|nr:unnamed protein product [Gongylonema pulchrum]